MRRSDELASSDTMPSDFLVSTRKTPLGERSAVQRWPCGVRTTWKSVRRSVGELNPEVATCSATSLGTSRTVPPAGRPSISA